MRVVELEQKMKNTNESNENRRQDGSHVSRMVILGNSFRLFFDCLPQIQVKVYANIFVYDTSALWAISDCGDLLPQTDTFPVSRLCAHREKCDAVSMYSAKKTP